MPSDALKTPYSLYLLLCKGDVIYTGITNDVQRRYAAHCNGKGAKFTKARPPKALLAHTLVGTKSQALRLEHHVKKLSRNQKVSFVQSFSPYDSPAS